MKPAYIQQRFHPTLRIGYTALVADMKNDVPAHCQQGDIDGACGLYSSSTALFLLGKINNPATIANSRSGVAARLWKAAHSVYFDGINSRELSELLSSLETDLVINECNGKHQQILAFAKDSMATGSIVLIAWRTKNHRHKHWTTAIGVSGVKRDGIFSPQAFLCLDPGQTQPDFACYNARLDFTERIEEHSRAYLGYWSHGDLTALPVQLFGAISLRNPG